MLFSSYEFLLLFLPATLAGFFGLRARGLRRASVAFLLAASIAFYARWNLGHLVLLFVSILMNYVGGRIIAGLDDPGRRRIALILGVGANLALIVWFKYFDFIASNAAAVVGADYTFRNLILPLGISFFTFQQVAYLVDCARTQDSERSFRDYALFVSFFPQLIAGPIVHHGYLRPQMQSIAKRPINLNYLPYGLMIFAMGLAKKTLVADPIARAIDPTWDAAAAGETIAAGAAWLATIGYSLQIYFDFSGYCDMAIGLGLLFGVKLPVNFNSPYKARSIIEFWRRWHMTLSAFLRDYVYIPLGGNRGGGLFRLRNIFLTMLIGGVWHGAAWTFVIWGAIHAAMITANHAARLYAPALDRLTGSVAGAVKQAATLAIVVIAWVYFRADGVDAAHRMFGALIDGAGDYAPDPIILALVAFAAAIALFSPNSLEIAGYEESPDRLTPQPRSDGRAVLRTTPGAAFATALMLTAGVAAAWKPAVFIYYNF